MFTFEHGYKASSQRENEPCDAKGDMFPANSSTNFVCGPCSGTIDAVTEIYDLKQATHYSKYPQ